MKIGYFGGTFDPPHIGHQILAAEALYQLDLDRVQWILTPTPPHKMDQEITPVEHRVKMIQSVFNGYPKFELSDIDLKRKPPLYAADTVELLKEQDPSSTLIYIIGEDSLRDLLDWYNPERFLNNIDKLCVAKRPNVDVDLIKMGQVLPGIENKVIYLKDFELEISSSIIRMRAGSDRPYRHLVSPAVYSYIETNQVY